MKRICTMTMMLLVTGLANAQQLTNPGFESWEVKGDYTDPANWNTLNALVDFGFDASTTQTTDAHSGNYAVKLESITSPFNDLSGVLCTGPILDDQFNADFSRMKIAFSGAPQKFEFYYKSDPEPGDTSIVFMCLTRWNASLEKTDTIATAIKLFYDSVGAYTQASITFEYESSLAPDSMFIIASSSANGFTPTVGSVLILDDLLLVYGPTAIEENKTASVSVELFPNPASSLVNVQSKTGTQELWLTDYSGKTVYNTTVNINQIDVTNFDNGIYFLTVLDQNNNRSTRKICIQH